EDFPNEDIVNDLRASLGMPHDDANDWGEFYDGRTLVYERPPAARLSGRNSPYYVESSSESEDESDSEPSVPTRIPQPLGPSY
ncbi:unnamed protein product, partial [Mycena citricolor]